MAAAPIFMPVPVASTRPGRRADVWEDVVSVSQWTNCATRRAFDLVAAVALLVLFCPLMLLLFWLVRSSSAGPALFRQERVGRNCRRFTLLKFRTMTYAAQPAAFQRSTHSDSRLTPHGAFLRKYKLDELPQLINVIRGEMSLVGPRPKLPELHMGPMPCRPGLTGAASLAFAAEALLVKDVPDHLVEELHSSLITPHKLLLDLEYMRDASPGSDARIVAQTLLRRGKYVSLAEVYGHASGAPQTM